METGGQPKGDAEPVFEIVQASEREDTSGAAPSVSEPRTRAAAAVVAVAGIVWVLVLASWLFVRADPSPISDEEDSEVSVPPALVAVERFTSAPGRNTAAALLASIGGVEALAIGSAHGEFDVVSFDPSDPDHLLASRRASYGLAENEDVNEEWFVADDQVVQTLFAPNRPHDFAQFSSDGSVAIWVNSGNVAGFASRTVAIERSDGVVVAGPVYASRSVVVDDTLFALTGSANYYSTERVFEMFVADRGGEVSVLGSGVPWSWVDSPAEGVVVAYPADAEGVTAVWDAASLRPLPNHPLSGRLYQRVAVSGDGRTALGVTTSGELEVLDLATGATVDRFGSLDPAGIAQPVTLNDDGTVAVTVAFDGAVTAWWVGDERPLLEIDADAGPPRVLSEHRAPRTSSAVAVDAERVALRIQATPTTPTTWRIIVTDLEYWIERACAEADEVAAGDVCP